MELHFIIDFGGNSPYITFEIQELWASNNAADSANPADMNTLLRDRLYHLGEGLKKNKVDLHPYFRSKVNQREALEFDKNSKKYNPKFLIIARDEQVLDNSPEASKLESFFHELQGNIVIKLEQDFNGDGNTFGPYINFENFLEKINDIVRWGEPFLIEEINLPIDKKDYSKGLFKTGTYNRYLIIYNEDTKVLQSFPIYRDILDISQSTNSHDNTIKLKSKGYFNFTEDFRNQEIKKRMLNKEQFFRDICEAIVKTVCFLPKGEFEENAFLKRDINENIFLSKKDIKYWKNKIQFNERYLHENRRLDRFNISEHQKNDKFLKKSLDYLENASEANKNIHILRNKYPNNYAHVRNTLAKIYYIIHGLKDKPTQEYLKESIDHLFDHPHITPEIYFNFVNNFKSYFQESDFKEISGEENHFFDEKNENYSDYIKEELISISYYITKEMEKFYTGKCPFNKKDFLFLNNIYFKIQNFLKNNIYNNLKSNLMDLIFCFDAEESYRYLSSLIYSLPDDSFEISIHNILRFISISQDLNDSQFEFFLSSLSDFKEIMSNPEDFEIMYNNLQEWQTPILINKLNESDFILELIPKLPEYLAEALKTDSTINHIKSNNLT